MIYNVTYDIICIDCGKLARHGEIGDYPHTWQFETCPHCGGKAAPNLQKPTQHEVTTISTYGTEDDCVIV